PYDTIIHPGGGGANPVDSASLIGVHEFVFSKKCAQPGCHDGSFEPDYRTVQSTYNTLVYHDVVKNNAQGSFKYRVVPFDTARSWLHERLTTHDAVLGRMPLYDTLADWQLQLVERWIMDGARDMFGNTPARPNFQPATLGIAAYLPDAGNYRVDTIRGRFFEPFYVPKNTSLALWFGLYDDKTVPPLFTVNQVKFSTDMYDFSGAVTYPLVVETSPKNHPGFDGKMYPFFHHITINTAQWSPGTIVYMRIYVKDPDHAQATEIPSGSSQFPLLTYFSFIIGE
nr:hypothetical protein [Bacteroidota bacterium]